MRIDHRGQRRARPEQHRCTVLRPGGDRCPDEILGRGRGDIERGVADPVSPRLACHIRVAQKARGRGGRAVIRERRRPDGPLQARTRTVPTRDGRARKIGKRRSNAELYCREEARLAFFEELNELYDTPDAQDVREGRGTAPGEVT